MASGTAEVVRNVPRSRQLDFNKAMSDFKVMFPSFDHEVIEMVLRANNGLVDATVDQLLSMQVESNEPKDSGLLDPELNVRLPSYDDEGATTFEPPPAYTPRVEEDPNFSYDSTFLEPHMSNFNPPVSSQNTSLSRTNNSQFQPPLLGTLPRDFLRLSVDDRPTITRPRQQHHGAISAENPLYEVSGIHLQQDAQSGHNSRFHQDSRPNSSAVARPSVNGHDHGFEAIPSNEETAKSCGKKGKSKKFGQMSRKFKKNKTKSTKGPTYQQMSGTNLIDNDDD